MPKLKNVVVYCGSTDGNEPCYIECAQALGQELLNKNIGLVYGSGKSGLMGKVSQTVHEGGGNVVGVISEHLHNHVSDGYGKTIIVKTMHDRKRIMFDETDGIIALPGGFGTMEELLEVVTWYQLGLHNKPIGLLNVNNYYDKFLEWIQHAQSQGFISIKFAYMLCHHDPFQLIKMMEEKEGNSEFEHTPWG